MSIEPVSQTLPADRDAFVVVRDGRAIGRFALCALDAHAAGRRLAAVLGGPRRVRFPGPHGLAHDLAIDPADGADALVLAAIARRSLARLYGAVFVCADASAAARLRPLGVELPAALAQAAIAPVIGVYEPARADNLARLRTLERGALLVRAA
jgi:hypothetical protein